MTRRLTSTSTSSGFASSDGAALVRYEQLELGVLYRDRSEAELPVLGSEHDELIEHGEPSRPA